MAEPHRTLIYGRIAIEAHSIAEARRIVGRVRKDVTKTLIDTEVENFSFGLYDSKGGNVSAYKQGTFGPPPLKIKVEEEDD